MIWVNGYPRPGPSTSGRTWFASGPGPAQWKRIQVPNGRPTVMLLRVTERPGMCSGQPGGRGGVMTSTSDTSVTKKGPETGPIKKGPATSATKNGPGTISDALAAFEAQ